jgi:hypothetical protein
LLFRYTSRPHYGKLVEEGLLVRDFPRNKRVANRKSRPRAKSSDPKANSKKFALQ